MAAVATAPQGSQPSNAQLRAYILAKGIPVLQPILSGVLTYTAGQPTVWTAQANAAGLLRRFFLVLKGTVNCAAAHTATPTMGGIMNLISNIQFTDQSNRLRINTSAWHLHLSASEKRKRPFGAALVASTGMTDPAGIGANFPVQETTGAVAGGTAKSFTLVLEIPIVNSNHDLTGLVYANQITSNNRFQFTLNPAAFVYNADGFNSAYTMDAALGTSLPTLTNLSWTLYQDFLDQFQQPNGSVVLPPDDINTALCYFMIQPGVQVAGQDNLYPLPPFYIYQNLMLFWDNYTYNTSTLGSDVNYIKIQISNSYVLRQYEAMLNSVLTRNIMGADMPGVISATQSGAVYNLDCRSKPLLVNQLSATNIVFNPNTVQAGASLAIGQEYLWKAGNAG